MCNYQHFNDNEHRRVVNDWRAQWTGPTKVTFIISNGSSVTLQQI